MHRGRMFEFLAAFLMLRDTKRIRFQALGFCKQARESIESFFAESGLTLSGAESSTSRGAAKWQDQQRIRHEPDTFGY